jgi:hypothetical protein
MSSPPRLRGQDIHRGANKRGQAIDAILSALLVIVRIPHIRHYLEETEPKALEQALEAIEGLEAIGLARGMSVSVTVSELHEGAAAAREGVVNSEGRVTT